MKLADPERGANVRRNLRRWVKPLLAMLAGWVVLTAAVLAGAVFYAQAKGLSTRRTELLAQSCGSIMIGLLLGAVLVVLVMADRRKDG